MRSDALARQSSSPLEGEARRGGKHTVRNQARRSADEGGRLRRGRARAAQADARRDGAARVAAGEKEPTGPVRRRSRTVSRRGARGDAHARLRRSGAEEGAQGPLAQDRTTGAVSWLYGRSAKRTVAGLRLAIRDPTRSTRNGPSPRARRARPRAELRSHRSPRRTRAWHHRRTPAPHAVYAQVPSPRRPTCRDGCRRSHGPLARWRDTRGSLSSTSCSFLRLKWGTDA